MKFTKYHALGNDYFVVEASEGRDLLSVPNIQRLCHRHFGVGSDGILVNAGDAKSGFRLRILNPDGSEAEKSGNGLRIFARYLWDEGLVKDTPFRVSTLGGEVCCQVFEDGRQVKVEMGSVSFQSTRIPMTGPDREVVKEKIEALDRVFEATCATIGNPHCVIPVQRLDKDEVLQYGPVLENHPGFPRRTNVQFMKVIDRSTIQIEIWERGAGYTLASGSSSSASAAVAHRLGLVDSDVTVRMPGGELSIHIDEGFQIVMTGPVTRIASGLISAECLL